MTIQLVEDTITRNDIDSLISWLKTYPRLTKGNITAQFENQFAQWMGSSYAVFVNSGSSANLLMLYALKITERLKNNKIAVPALSWATDVSPVIQLNMVPLLVDCNLENLAIDLSHLEKIFQTENPAALILVSVLGLSPDMEKIINLCKKYNVILLEDNCESQGTMYGNKKLGTFGAMSSFSTYFGHIMSTIEGGIITTDDEELYTTLLQLRSHGWSRDLPTNKKELLRNQWNVDEFSELYTFYIPGFNVRSTDLQAYLGVEQLKKVDSSISKRNKNFKLFEELLKNKVWFPLEVQNSFTASFCIPVVTNTEEQKKHLIKLLQEYGVECRPLISGSMGTQPFYKKIYGETILPNCSIVDTRGLYIPNHQNLLDVEIELMANLVLRSHGIF
jgi:CDP-4-dehydro-6-deoxyglucose reductase, E1